MTSFGMSSVGRCMTVWLLVVGPSTTAFMVQPLMARHAATSKGHQRAPPQSTTVPDSFQHTYIREKTREPYLTSALRATESSSKEPDVALPQPPTTATNADDWKLWEKVAGSLSTTAATRFSRKYGQDMTPIGGSSLNTLTLIRTLVPSLIAGVVATLAFPGLSLWLCSGWTDAGVFAVLSQDSSQFVQNFLTVAGLLFSILVGQTYYFMYQQQEMVYYALFNEVTEAKSLLEQVALVCQGRTMYRKVLSSIQNYVERDLKNLQTDPAQLLSARPVDDPLETIMYLTSVGVPSTVYETVRSLRQARAQRLGALQRKLPYVHMLLLWILGAIELVSFPLLGAGTQTIGGYNLLTVEGTLFGVMTAGIVLTLRVVGELWRPAGGAYNVDNVLKVMVKGLERELKARMDGKMIGATSGNHPSPAIDAEFLKRSNPGVSSGMLGLSGGSTDKLPGSASVPLSSSTLKPSGEPSTFPRAS